MGSSLRLPQPDFQHHFRESYSFVQLLEDPNYGLVKVYRKRQLNYDYVMVFEESLAGMTRQQTEELLRQLELISGNPHPQLLKLFHYQLVRDEGCSGSGYLRLYLEYYNFSLQNLVELNSKSKIYLDVQEVLYILNSVLSVVDYFRRLEVSWFSIAASQIVLSTTGCVYFSPVRVGRSSAEMDLCGGCTIIQTAKYDRNLPQAANRNLKHELKRLLLELTQHYPKKLLSQFQPLFAAIELADSIHTVELPQSKACAIDMMKQMYRMPDEQSESESHSRQRIPDESSFSSRQSMATVQNVRTDKTSLKPTRSFNFN